MNEIFSYHLAAPIAEEDLRSYIQDPIAALPPSVTQLLPKIGLVLAPYLERNPTRGGAMMVADKPSESKLLLSAHVVNEAFATMFFTVRDEQVSDYHYYFYAEIANLLAAKIPAKVRNEVHRLLREELAAEVHGEVDERSWLLKQSLVRRPMAARRDSKLFRDYVKQSFVDTMTLYLHGICCDIDVETGPRQLPSRNLRRRLQTFKQLFPPPAGHAVFPEDLKTKNR